MTMMIVRYCRLNEAFRRLSCQKYFSKRHASQALYMWGTNTKGIIPSTTLGAVLEVPTKVDFITPLMKAGDSVKVSIKQVCCGNTSTGIITSDGKCYTMGDNYNGQLGLGHKTDALEATRLASPEGIEDFRIQHICMGEKFSAVIDEIGDLYTFGWDGSTFSGMGALGHGDGQSHHETPKRVESLVEDGCLVDQVHVGESHMTVLTTEREVLTAGAGSFGRLGNVDILDQLFLEPVEMMNNLNVHQIAGGQAFTLALTRDGIIYGWGRNDKGQLGVGLGLAVDMYAMSELPQPIESDDLLNRIVVKIAAGHSHAACLTNNGELFMWGMGTLEPELQRSLLHSKIVDVHCGKDYTIALDEHGKLYSFGTGKAGVLGQGHKNSQSQPTVIEGLSGKNISLISAGWNQVACIVENES